MRNHGFVCYSDSSWGNKYPYPMFGYGVYLFGGLISFASKQLKTVAFSSCEAEYAAASYCCKEIEFVDYLKSGILHIKTWMFRQPHLNLHLLIIVLLFIIKKKETHCNISHVTTTKLKLLYN